MPQPIKKRREAALSCKGSLDGLDLALLDRGTMAVKQPKDCPRWIEGPVGIRCVPDAQIGHEKAGTIFGNGPKLEYHRISHV